MTAFNATLQRACFEALDADADLTALLSNRRIFDRVPERVRPPYVVLGRSTVSDWSTATEDGEAIVFFVHTWSRGGDRAESNLVQEHVRRVLTEDVAVEGASLIALRFQLAETRRDRPSGYLHGVMRFRAVIEPVTN
ncbi:MAG: DUF3168 domain-containing protein [Pseudomonadota bacterium]